MADYCVTFSNGRDGVRRINVDAENAFDARKLARGQFPHARYVSATRVLPPKVPA